MNSDKELYNEESDWPPKNDDKRVKKAALKKVLRTILTVAEIVSVCIVYVLVLYFLISTEMAFAMWDNTTDIIFIR